MTEATRSAECTAATATLYVAFELGSTKWTVAATTGPAQRPRLREVRAGDLSAVRQELLTAKARFGLPLEAPVRSCYEAGRDGFWFHRWLIRQDVANVVVESSSIQVDRRARRAKTDRLDACQLLAQLGRWAAGERQVWRVVQVPTPEAEDQRQLTREIATVSEERTRTRNRIHALLATQGLRLVLNQGFLDRLALTQTGDGRPVPPAWRARIERDWQALETIERRLTTLRAARDAAIATGEDRVSDVARRLCQLRGVAETSAAVFSAELFGTREFANGRQVGALTGLVPVPYRSDQRVQDQGISKAARAELRRMALQVAWGWQRWQPDSVLTLWFRRRFVAAGGRSKRIGIVALARKLMIALWHFAAQGVVPAGARLKPLLTA